MKAFALGVFIACAWATVAALLSVSVSLIHISASLAILAGR